MISYLMFFLYPAEIESKGSIVPQTAIRILANKQLRIFKKFSQKSFEKVLKEDDYFKVLFRVFSTEYKKNGRNILVQNSLKTLCEDMALNYICSEINK